MEVNKQPTKVTIGPHAASMVVAGTHGAREGRRGARVGPSTPDEAHGTWWVRAPLWYMNSGVGEQGDSHCIPDLAKHFVPASSETMMIVQGIPDLWEAE